MASSEEKRTERRVSRKEEEPAATLPGKKIGERQGILREEADELLEEIDKVLEENAEEFVRNYIQRGGE